MNNNIILKALETELKRQEKLLETVNKMIEYNPLEAINEKQSEINSLSMADPDQRKKAMTLLNEFSALRKALDKRDFASLVKKQWEYNDNITTLTSAIFGIKNKMTDHFGNYVLATFNGNPLAKIKAEKEGK